MFESLFNPHWFRVATLRPKLGAQVRVQRQRYRDQTWYILTDTATDIHHRINAAAYQFVGRCDGQRTVNELWEFLLARRGDDAPTQGDIIRVLSQLSESELLRYATKPDIEALFRVHGERRRRRARERINPLAFRVPLIDPSALLRRIEPLLPILFHPATIALWAVITLAGVVAAAVNWQVLAAHAGTNMMTSRTLLLAWLCYPVIKALHELAHAAAVKRWGGEVHEAGITLLVFTPAPYVDASAATAFRDRRQRAAVSAAGIMVELLLASLALWVWLGVQPGLIRDIAFVTLFIGSVSTLVLNGNPLLRFDGYYLLSDALDVPNLASRSTAYWVYLLQRYVLRAAEPVPPPSAAGERKWLVLYAPLSLAYRLIITGAILMWIGGKSWLLGLLAAALMFGWLLVRPVREMLRALLPAGRPHGREGAVLAGVALLAAGLAVAVPVPFTVTAQAVVWPPEDAQLRPEIDGFIAGVLATSGEQVEAGQVVIELSDPVLLAARSGLLSRFSGLRAEQYGAMLHDPVRALDAEKRIERTQAELERAEQRIAGLQVRSNVTGRLVLPRPEDLRDGFARRGALMGYVLTPGSVNVRAVVSGEDAPLIRASAQRAEVRLAERPGVPVEAQIVRDMPAASASLPTAALGERAGGALRTDPLDKTGMRAVEPFFQFDLMLAGERLERIGGRAWVRFDLGSAPLAVQAYRRLSQLLLRHVNPDV